MKIVFLAKLNEFSKSHANARNSITSWKRIVEKTGWKKKQDILADFPKAKMVKNNRARFEIAHKTYRLIVQIHYEEKIVEIRFIGTHNEYERIDSETI
jgi:mRNA interferase HigB